MADKLQAKGYLLAQLARYDVTVRCGPIMSVSLRVGSGLLAIVETRVYIVSSHPDLVSRMWSKAKKKMSKF